MKYVLTIIPILFLTLGGAAIAGGGEQNIRDLAAEYKQLLQEARSADKDTSVAVERADRAKKAIDSGDRETAVKLIKEAITLLKEGQRSLPNVQTAYKPMGRILELKNSPFGIHDPTVPKRPVPPDAKLPPGVDRIEDVREAGATWVRYAGASGLVWDLIETGKGVYDWSKTDQLYGESHRNGLHVLSSVFPYNRQDGKKFYVPHDMNWYAEFLAKAARRYSGVVDVWQIGNELDTPVFWKDELKNYITLLKVSSKAIRRADPKAKVAIAGVAGPQGFPLYAELLDMLKEDGLKGKRYFDIFDLHWATLFGGNYKAQSDGKRLEDFIRKARAKLNEIGYTDVPIWITEISDYSGSPWSARGSLPQKSETDQAASLLKMNVYALAHGVQKIFWVTLSEWHGSGWSGEAKPGGYFDTVGLIKNAKAGGQSYKKLAYYTYKSMTDILGEADPNSVTTLQEGDRFNVFRFTRSGRFIWVIWSDSSDDVPFTLAGVRSSRVAITRSVPASDTGLGVKEYARAFTSTQRNVDRGAVQLVAGNVPIFVEER